jgi:hypothetical protein
MRENEERHEVWERNRCQIAHVPGKPTSSSCTEPAKERVDGLLLCEWHALEAKLEGQIYCWKEMLFHIDIWSREARRRERPDVVVLLEDQRARARAARRRAFEDLDVLRRGEPPWALGVVPSGGWGLSRRGSLPLPPGGARRLSRGLRDHPRR